MSRPGPSHLPSVNFSRTLLLLQPLVNENVKYDRGRAELGRPSRGEGTAVPEWVRDHKPQAYREKLTASRLRGEGPRAVVRKQPRVGRRITAAGWRVSALFLGLWVGGGPRSPSHPQPRVWKTELGRWRVNAPSWGDYKGELLQRLTSF